jgi:hypothetical protein
VLCNLRPSQVHQLSQREVHIARQIIEIDNLEADCSISYLRIVPGNAAEVLNATYGIRFYRLAHRGLSAAEFAPAGVALADSACKMRLLFSGVRVRFDFNLVFGEVFSDAGSRTSAMICF